MMEINEDRYYDSLLAKYNEEAKVPFTDYQKLEEENEILKGQIKDIISYLQENDIAGAYEYVVKEGLV